MSALGVATSVDWLPSGSGEVKTHYVTLSLPQFQLLRDDIAHAISVARTEGLDETAEALIDLLFVYDEINAEGLSCPQWRPDTTNETTTSSPPSDSLQSASSCAPMSL